jgi:7,8-dihydroneopterin aldolase/epimerase/oxygenase
MSKLDIIRLHNAVFYAYHGVLKDEQTIGGKFEVDIDLHADLTAARTTDQLHHTVNYEQAYGVVKKAVTEKKFYLIEALAHQIGQALLREFPPVEKVVVRVRKPGAPVHGVLDTIEVEIESARKE